MTIGKNGLYARGNETVSSLSARSPFRILVAEDDIEMRKLLAWSLSRKGYEVVECNDGNALMKHIVLSNASKSTEAFDLVLSDVRMPGENGLQALARAMKFRNFPPVLLITAFPTQETREQARRLGAEALFAKPFDIEDLLDRIAQIISLRMGQEPRQEPFLKTEQDPLMFPLDIVFRHNVVSGPVRPFIHALAAKLNRYAGHIVRCRVILDRSNSHDRLKQRYHVHIRLSTPGKTIAVKHDSDKGEGYESLYQAVQNAFDTVCRRLEDDLRKRMQKRTYEDARAMNRFSEEKS